ncbi:MAG TPA: diguanylate cyclase [Azospira sp.]|nr:diguanylate cyclase [Azospira sp.]
MTTLTDYPRRLEARLLALLGLGLLVFSAVAGFFSYRYAYWQQLEAAASLQRQLVQTVQAQAEVAAFAANGEIAQGVLDGLLANPVVRAARIESGEGFKVELGSRHSVDFAAGRSYPLYSPVDHLEAIGTLVVVQNNDQVERIAAQAAIYQTLLMLAQLVMATLIVAVVLRHKVIGPITRLAHAMAQIQPGSAQRLAVEEPHAGDEIGLLARSANALLDTAEAAIGEVNAQRIEMEKLATHDHLTGLPSLRLAEDRLQVACSKALRAEAKVALLFIDLDEFKTVNDNYGHEAGDAVLCEVARRLRECIRAEDTAARIGGDEFLVILGDLPDAQTAATVARNIGSALARPIDTPGHVVHTGASIGIALYPDHTGNVDAMRHVADQAMYRVKRSGKGRFAFVDQPANDSAAG